MRVTVKDESVIYDGEIYREGQSFDVDEPIGNSLIERGLVTTTPAATEDETNDDSEVTDWRAASYPDLKKMAGDMGLPTNGKKDDLIERIAAAMEDETEDGADETAGDLPNTSMPD